MNELWKADVVRDLYLYQITRKELAKEMNVSASYLNMVLAGSRKGKSVEEPMRAAIERIVANRKVGSDCE